MAIKSKLLLIITIFNVPLIAFSLFDDFLLFMGPPQGFWGSGENGYLFSGGWGALVIILGELGSKLIILGI